MLQQYQGGHPAYPKAKYSGPTKNNMNTAIQATSYAHDLSADAQNATSRALKAYITGQHPNKVTDLMEAASKSHKKAAESHREAAKTAYGVFDPEHHHAAAKYHDMMVENHGVGWSG